LSFDHVSLKPITQLLPSFILMKADEARTLALHNTVQALASEMAEQVPGSEVVATRLAEVLFIQVLRAHIASGPERNKGWLRAVFDPQMGTALSAIHDSVKTPWTVESLAEAAGMSRSAFAARFKELLGQTPWNMSPSGGCRRRCSYYGSGRRSSSTLLGWSVTSPALRSIRRSSELTGPTPGNTSNVVLKARVMPEWRTTISPGNAVRFT
jgi:AraC-like DNA-binding protein